MIATVTTAGLILRLQENFELVRQRLDRYIEANDDECIHDLRTAIRRLRTAYGILPAECRSRSSEGYMELSRELFRHNSRARDCDVMRAKLMDQGVAGDDDLIRQLQDERKKLSRAAKVLARRLKKRKLPMFEPGDGQIVSNYHQQFEKYLARFLQAMPAVLTADSNCEEIHAMRKDAKRLHYLLELVPDPADDRRMIHLKLFQRLSGDLHDCDVTIDFLEEYPESSARVSRLLACERLMRHGLYTEMCGLLQGADWDQMLRDAQ